MPLSPGKSPKIVSRNISEFHTGKTYSHTAAKFGKKKADAQAIAVALSNARRYGRRYADGGEVPDDLSFSDIPLPKPGQQVAPSLTPQGMSRQMLDTSKGAINLATPEWLKDYDDEEISRRRQTIQQMGDKPGKIPELDKENQRGVWPSLGALEGLSWAPLGGAKIAAAGLGAMGAAKKLAPKAAEAAAPIAEDAAKGWHFLSPYGGDTPKWHPLSEDNSYELAAIYNHIAQGDKNKAINLLGSDFNTTDVSKAEFQVAQGAIDQLKSGEKLPQAKWLGPNNPYPELEAGAKPKLALGDMFKIAETGVPNKNFSYADIQHNPDWHGLSLQDKEKIINAYFPAGNSKLLAGLHAGVKPFKSLTKQEQDDVLSDAVWNIQHHNPASSAEQMAAAQATKKWDNQHIFDVLAGNKAVTNKEADAVLKHWNELSVAEQNKIIQESQGAKSNNPAQDYADKQFSKLKTNKSQVDQIVDQMKDYMAADKAEGALGDIANKFQKKTQNASTAYQNSWDAKVDAKLRELNQRTYVHPDIKARAEAMGLNQPAYHGTTKVTDGGHAFEEFKLPTDEIGIHFGTKKAAHDIMDAGGRNARIYPVMIKAKNPLDLPDLGTWFPYKIANALKGHTNIPKAEIDAAYKPSEYGMEHPGGKFEKDETQAIKNLRALIQKYGYDSIRYKNKVEDPGSISYIALDPSHVRSMYAKFNPKNKHLPHLAAGLAGAGWVGVNMKEQQEGGMAAGGKVIDRVARKYANGGSTPWFVRQEANHVFREGMLHSSVPGRTDKLPINVSGGSYVVPADIVSALGQGNSLSGNNILRKMFSSGPYGMATMHGGAGRINTGRLPRASKISSTKTSSFHFARGGDTQATPIIAAGGEYVVPPEVVEKIGGGDMTHGHKILDKFVLEIRKKHIKTLKKLPGPAKD